MIKSFANTGTEQIAQGKPSRKFPLEIQKTAYRKLAYIDNAVEIDDLLIPPGNRLEKLFGDRAGQWSVRINRQWRICFEWNEGNAYEVEIVDYH